MVNVMKFIMIILTSILTGCVSTSTPMPPVEIAQNPKNKEDAVILPGAANAKLQKSLVHNYNKGSKNSDEIAADFRINAISIDAYSWGIQEGVYYRTSVIQGLLEKYSNVVHKMISLGKFIVDGKMLMPTVIETEGIYVRNSDVSSTEISMSYTLDKPARIVSQVPTWRDYLKRTVPEPEYPIDQSLPKTQNEQIAWNKEFKRGFQSGIKQANSIYEKDLARMHADIAGLYRYRYLLSQNIVLLPVISNERTGVVLLDSGKTIYLNNVEHSIEMNSIFNDINEWKPVFNQGDAHE